MIVFFRFIIFCFDPLGIGRRFFINPAFNIVWKLINSLTTKANEHARPLKELILRLGLVAFAVVLIIWLAGFMYAAFYYFYMPAISHTRPVNMQFKTCAETNSPCSFPHAHVPLTKKQQLLMYGQAYRVIVNIEMPESPQNVELGMFMVCAELRDKSSMLRGHSCRSAMMRYRSPLIRTLSTWLLSPLLVLGLKEEFQYVPVEIFSTYLEERRHPITDVFVEIQSQKIQFYTVTLHIVADFTGLRYIMFNFPVFSAVIAISTNLFFILLVFLLSWYHWSDTTWMNDFKEKYERAMIANKYKSIKNTKHDAFKDNEDVTTNDEDIETISGASHKTKEQLYLLDEMELQLTDSEDYENHKQEKEPSNEEQTKSLRKRINST